MLTKNNILLIESVAEQIHKIIGDDRAGWLRDLTFSDYCAVVDKAAIDIVRTVQEGNT